MNPALHWEELHLQRKTIPTDGFFTTGASETSDSIELKPIPSLTLVRRYLWQRLIGAFRLHWKSRELLSLSSISNRPVREPRSESNK